VDLDERNGSGASEEPREQGILGGANVEGRREAGDRCSVSGTVPGLKVREWVSCIFHPRWVGN
jgi:hypothetical protein